MTAFLKSTNGPINFGLDRLHKHMQLGVISEKVVVQTMSTDNPTDVYTVNSYGPRTDPWGTP